MIFITFLFFFFFQVCRELSGYYAFTGEEEITSKEKKQMKIGTIPAIVLITIVSIIFCVLAYVVRIKPPSNTRFPFIIELLLFALVLSLAEVFIGHTHSDNQKELIFTGTTSFIMYVAVGIVLQYGGIYKHFFEQTNSG